MARVDKLFSLMTGFKRWFWSGAALVFTRWMDMKLIESNELFLKVTTIEGKERVKLFSWGFAGHTESCG